MYLWCRQCDMFYLPSTHMGCILYLPTRRYRQGGVILISVVAGASQVWVLSGTLQGPYWLRWLGVNLGRVASGAYECVGALECRFFHS